MAQDEPRDAEPRPEQISPESAYEGRLPPEEVPTNDPTGGRTRPTGGIPSRPDQAVGPEGARADPNMRREAGGAPSERRESE
jgi:hypothetical protein